MTLAPVTRAATLLAAVALLAGACGGASARPARIVGNDAVHARLGPLPPLPIDPALEIRRASVRDLRAFCGWQARAVGAYDVETTCRDGARVRIASACSDEDLDAMREGLAICALTVGEWAACVAARRDAPCEGGLFGERLPECEAFTACIAAAMEEGHG
ncbi:MAG: hypothetical protein ACK5U8_26215 [Deltaproteobacteria bacterium]